MIRSNAILASEFYQHRFPTWPCNRRGWLRRSTPIMPDLRAERKVWQLSNAPRAVQATLVLLGAKRRVARWPHGRVGRRDRRARRRESSLERASPHQQRRHAQQADGAQRRIVAAVGRLLARQYERSEHHVRRKTNRSLHQRGTTASKRFYVRRLRSGALLLVRNKAPTGSVRSHLMAFHSSITMGISRNSSAETMRR